MLDTAGKFYKRLLKQRLQSSIESAGDLSPRQYGFRKGHSTLNAVTEVVSAIQRADTASHQARPIMRLATLDVRNALNSARWEDMLEALQRLQGARLFPGRLQDYLMDRRLSYETEEGMRFKEVTTSTAQVSILGPDLWNVPHDGLLRLEMPQGVFLVCYADDVAAVITERTSELTQLRLNQITIRVNGWMSSHGLKLVIAKT